jgi:hypothetical protein
MHHLLCVCVTPSPSPLLLQNEGHVDPVSASIVMMSKQQAKEVMVRNLPIHEGVLRKVLDVIGPLATRIAETRHAERAALRPDPKNRGHSDPSHLKITQTAFQQCNSRILNPLEVSELDEQKRKEREQQEAAAREAAALRAQEQQMQQQQALALQQQQQQAAAQAAAQAMAQQQQMQQQHQMQQQQMQQQQMQQQQQQQQQQAAAAAAQQGGMPGANAAMVAAAQQQQAVAAQQQQQAAMAAAQQQAAQHQAAALAAGMGQVRSVTPGGTVVAQGGGPGMNAMQGAGERCALRGAGCF